MSQNSKLHKNVPTTFRLSPVNGLLGSYSRFNKENFGQQVGELAELIFRIFYEDKSVFSYADTLSLINVTNYVNARSTGYSISPPYSVIGFNTGLAFTFALSARPYSKRLPELNSKEKNSDGVDTVSYWSTGGSSYTYLTISFDKSSLRRLSLSFNTVNLGSKAMYLRVARVTAPDSPLTIKGSPFSGTAYILIPSAAI